jgi:hypothetical protein
MTDKNAAQTFEVRGVRGVDGPVGMDVRLWLKFDTDQGEVHLKIADVDARALKDALAREPAIAVQPRRIVSETSETLTSLATELSATNDETAERLRQLANDLERAATRLPADD